MRLECERLGIRLDCLNAHSTKAHVHHVFCELVHGLYDVDMKGRPVVDIGAFYGETAIYFSRQGASTVYCYEPFASGKLILANAMLNCCDNILYFPEAVGAEVATLKADPEFINHGGTRLNYAANRDKELHQTDLNTITEGNGIQDGILKMDCEGSEFGIIRGASKDTLSRYRTIIMEVHGFLGEKEPLLLKLVGCNFSVEVVESLIDSMGGYAGREVWKCKKQTI